MNRNVRSVDNRVLFTRLSVLAFLIVSTCANAAGSLLRVACEGGDVGAEVYVNGKFRGECPVDIQVGEGIANVRVVKKVDADRVRAFEQQSRIADGTIKKIDVVLSAPLLTPEAQQRETERLAAEHAEATKREQARQLALAAQRQRDDEAVQEGLRAMEARDAGAMLTLADRYASGNGVTRSDERAQEWYRQAAAAGNAVAAFKLTDLYKRGSKRDVDAVLRLLALPVDSERQVKIEGDKAIQAFIAIDRFFFVPGGNEKLAYVFERASGATLPKTTIDVSCGRDDGPVFRTQSKPRSSSYGLVPDETVSILGGLSWLETRMFGNRTTRSEVLRLDVLHGEPLPIKPGKRFGMSYAWKADNTGGSVITERLDCSAENTRDVTCLVQRGAFQAVSRHSWHERSGCFLRASDG